MYDYFFNRVAPFVATMFFKTTDNTEGHSVAPRESQRTEEKAKIDTQRPPTIERKT